MDDCKIAAAYVRVSTDDQLEYSPDSQLKLIREYANREGYIIPDEYIFREDDGVSGKSADKRPQFRLMIAQAKESNAPFSAIFVWKYSRFARNQEEAIMYKNLLRKHGIEVKSISEPTSDSPFSSLIERIIEWMDEYYLINLASEVKRGMKEKAERGEVTGRAPYGYKAVNKILVPDENAPNVKYMFELCASGVSFRKIAVILDEKGIRPKKGKKFDAYTVRYVLRNPVYIGKLRWSEDEHPVYRGAAYSPDKQELFDGKHEPIISQELWDAAQKNLEGRDTDVKYVRYDKPIIYMTKGLLRCDSCGGTLVRTVKRGKTEALQCYRYSRGQCKVSHSIKMETADQTIISALEKIVEDGSFVFEPQEPKDIKIKRDWDKLIKSEEARIERAKNAMIDGAISLDDFKSIKQTAMDNLTKLLTAKEQEEAERPKPIDKSVYKRRVLDVIEILKAPDVSREMKNSALRTILSKIVFKKPENEFIFYFLE